jgi:hypothetical protein
MGVRMPHELGLYSDIRGAWLSNFLNRTIQVFPGFGGPGLRSRPSLWRALRRTLCLAIPIFGVPNAATMQPAAYCTAISTLGCMRGVTAALSPCQFW